MEEGGRGSWAWNRAPKMEVDWSSDAMTKRHANNPFDVNCIVFAGLLFFASAHTHTHAHANWTHRPPSDEGARAF